VITTGIHEAKTRRCTVKLYSGRETREPGTSGRPRPDYHWYRQDSNGGWSSKHGQSPVGPQTDPATDAAAWGYTDNCGCMCAPD
jgi:hypothetical protein